MVTRSYVKLVGVGVVTLALSVGINWYLFTRSIRRVPPGVGGRLGVGGGLRDATQRNWERLLDLDPRQRAELARIETGFSQDLKQLETELAKTRMALCRVLRQAPTGTPAVDPYIQTVARLQTDQEQRVVSHLTQLRRLLRPDQDQRLFETLMQDICTGCRTATGSDQCICGMCEMKKGRQT
ncbi:MAG: periplasmic heavy metal sensor [Elusimicrobia bacterium]|nr:periplasmic heavy metal sensor [Elusimicrobiota bacterium]